MPTFTQCLSAVALLSGALLSAGCATKPVAGWVLEHPQINISPEGYPLDQSDKVLDEERFAAHADAVLDDVEHWISTRSREQPIEIMVVVHGGLNSRADRNQYIQSVIERTGNIKDTQVYPLFINWDSSLTSALWEDLFEVRRGVRNPVLGVITSPFVFAERLVTSLIRAPVTLVNHYDAEKRVFENWQGEQPTAGERAKEAGLMLLKVPTTIVTVPFLGGFGAGAWDMLSRRIEQMFALELRPFSQLLKERDQQTGAARQFLEVFAQRAKQWRKDNASNVKLSLMGHSMGAIVATRALIEFPQIEYDRIVYLAPAVSIEAARASLSPYLRENARTEFFSLALSVRDEAREWHLLAPRGSLLVWVDSMLAYSLSSGDRRLGVMANNKAISYKTVDETVCKRLHFLKFTGKDGLPRKHGDFDEDGMVQKMLAIATPTWHAVCPSCVAHKVCEL